MRSPNGNRGSLTTRSPSPLSNPGGDVADRAERRRRELGRRRQELLAAAERLLARKRFQEVSVQDIARESGFSVGYVYKLFSNKDEIMAELVRAKFTELRHLVDEAFREGGWEQKVRRLLARLFAWLEDTPAYRSGVTPDLALYARTNPAVAAELAGFRALFKAAIDHTFRDAVARGELFEREDGEIGRTLRALIGGFTEEHSLHREVRRLLVDDAELIVRVIKRAFSPEGSDKRP